MKKIFSLILVLAVLLCLAPTAFAAGSAYWGGPKTVRAGDTISLTFYAGGGIYGGSGTVSYDSSLLTLKGYSSAIGGSWAVEFGGNRFVFYDNSMSSPISGSAALAVGAELMAEYGVDSLIGRTAAVMLGSTETTFYTISVYFGAAGISKTRYTIPAALFADLVGFTMAAWTVKWMM